MAGFVVPAVLRGARFVPWQAPGRREPARVSAGAFQAAGLRVPEHPGQRNIYQLTGRRGLPWSPGVDAQIRRRGGELLGQGNLILVDIDCPAAVDGGPLLHAVRWLADRAVQAGGLLDLSVTSSCRAAKAVSSPRGARPTWTGSIDGGPWAAVLSVGPVLRRPGGAVLGRG